MIPSWQLLLNVSIVFCSSLRKCGFLCVFAGCIYPLHLGEHLLRREHPWAGVPTGALQSWVLPRHQPLTDLHHKPLNGGDAAYEQSMGSD